MNPSEIPWNDYDALREIDLDVPDDETLRATAFVDKGGTSKTTSLAHMAVVANNELGLDTVLVALDGKQNDLATHFGLDGEESGLADYFGLDEPDDQDETELEDALKWPTIAQAFAPNWEEIDERLREEGDDERGALAEMIVETGEGPDLIPASEGLDGVDSSLGNIDETAARYSILDEFLNEYVDPYYDLILIDVPGSTSNIANNALWATKHVLTPVRPSPLDTKQAQQIRTEIDEKIQQHEELTELELTMVMLSQIDSRTKAGEYFMDQFSEAFPIELAPEPVQNTQAVVNAQLERKTLFAYETDSETAKQAREQYRLNTAELIRRLATSDWKDEETEVDA